MFAAILVGGTRGSQEALLFGVPEIPHENLPVPHSEVFPHIGFARLSGPGSDLTEVMKFGPHGGVHGHDDILSEVLYAGGRQLSVDPGTQFYSVPSHDTWDKETVAHNTLVVDGESQAPTGGTLLDWQVTPDFTSIKAEAGHAYPGVSIQRRVLVTARYILEITDAQANDGKTHTFDWVYHNYGAQHVGLSTSSWAFPEHGNGYQHLTKNRSAVTGSGWRTDFAIQGLGDAPSHNVHLTMCGQPNTRVIFGNGLGLNLDVPVPYVMARRSSAASSFAVVIEPNGGEPEVERIDCADHDRYVIHSTKWTDTISVGQKTTIVRSTN
jgi:hypothetical protein